MSYAKHEVYLSKKAINKLIEKYSKYESKINVIVTDSINETLEYGKDFVNQEASKIRLPDERKAYEESYIIKAEKVGNKTVGYLRTDNQKATYAENGTGIVGSRHPNTSIKGWEYDVNKYGEGGWDYMASDGHVYHTKGIPAQKIYYNASIEMRKKLKELIIEKLKQ